jgi:hypothetical protein
LQALEPLLVQAQSKLEPYKSVMLGTEQALVACKQLLAAGHMYPFDDNQRKQAQIVLAQSMLWVRHNERSLDVTAVQVQHRLGHNFGHSHNHKYCRSGQIVRLRWRKRPSLRKS